MLQSFPKTYILRHRRENLKKCSLRGLEKRNDIQFFTYPVSQLPDLSSYILLALDGPPLSGADASHGIFLLDATWRHAVKMREFVDRHAVMEKRSIPKGYRTAYPRRQEDCADPEAGLASVEALYIAYHILGRDPSTLLDGYHWKDEFLELNSHMFTDL